MSEMGQNLTAQDHAEKADGAKRPRDYQVEAVTAAAEALKAADRIPAVMACGTGKTITSLRLFKRPSEDDQALIAIAALSSTGLLGQPAGGDAR